MSSLPRLIVVLGPTASGKSALAIALAQKLDGEVLACDSTQVYRYFDIGTGKMPAAEQKGIPHHLVDLVEPTEVFTAGQYRERALQVLDDLRVRKKLPIITAGTGLYLRALLEGLSDAPTRSEELRGRLRAKSERRGPAHLHKLLVRLDRETAERIAPRDTPKIIRAIEIRLLAGKRVGEVHRAGRAPLQGYNVIKIGLQPSREALYKHINARVENMIEQGWPEEVRRLIARGVPPDAKPFQFIGYSDLRRRIESGQSVESAIPLIQQATRNFAKRQITWFRKEASAHWLTGFGDEPTVLTASLKLIMGESNVKS
jgi:tRNA dimethylallyltransferase